MRRSHIFLKFSVNNNVKVYVAYDQRATTYPNWLTSSFTKTNQYIGVTDGAQRLVLWVQRFRQGEITLGANMAAGAVEPRSMYIVILEIDHTNYNGNDDGNGQNTEGLENYMPGEIPNVFALHQNFPNPFNPETEIRYQLPKESNVSITIYNVLGRRVKTLFEGPKEAGYLRTFWNAVDEFGYPIASGIYFCRIDCRKTENRGGLMVEVSEFTKTIKLMYMK